MKLEKGTNSGSRRKSPYIGMWFTRCKVTQVTKTPSVISNVQSTEPQTPLFWSCLSYLERVQKKTEEGPFASKTISERYKMVVASEPDFISL